MRSQYAVSDRYRTSVRIWTQAPALVNACSALPAERGRACGGTARRRPEHSAKRVVSKRKRKLREVGRGKRRLDGSILRRERGHSAVLCTLCCIDLYK